MHNSTNICEPFQESLSLLAAGCLSDSETSALTAHLATCVSCQQRHLELTTLARELFAARPEIPSGMAVGLPTAQPVSRTALHRQPIHRQSREPRLRVLLLTSALLLLVLGVLPRGSRESFSPPGPVPLTDVAKGAGGPEEIVLPPQPPTLLALRRAAERSDDSFDQLLASYSQPASTQSLTSHSLWQELTP